MVWKNFQRQTFMNGLKMCNDWMLWTSSASLYPAGRVPGQWPSWEHHSDPAPEIELSLQSVLLTFSHRNWLQRAFVCFGFSFGQHKRGNKGNAGPLYLGATGHPIGKVQKWQGISALLFCMLNVALNIADRHLRLLLHPGQGRGPFRGNELSWVQGQEGFPRFQG